jgi:hypothetical protein
LECYIEIHIDWDGLFTGEYPPNREVYINITTVNLFAVLVALKFPIAPTDRTLPIHTIHPKVHQLLTFVRFIETEVLTDENRAMITARIAKKDKCKIGEEGLEAAVKSLKTRIDKTKEQSS